MRDDDGPGPLTHVSASRAPRCGLGGRYGPPLNPPPLWRSASVVRDRRHVGDGAHLEAGCLQRADGSLPTSARTPNEYLDRAHAVLEGLLGGGLSCDLGGERRRLAAALETLSTRRAPRDDVPVHVSDRDDRVVERALDVGLPRDNVLALAAPGPDYFFLGHYLPALTFFLPATARLGPRRPRALVRVRWPRTRKPRRWRPPR